MALDSLNGSGADDCGEDASRKAQELVEKLDTHVAGNGDGVIPFEEFQPWLSSLFFLPGGAFVEGGWGCRLT